MGGNSSTRRVSFEADENDNITVVKGIRLSENVINRMREPAPSLTRPPPLTPESSVSPAGMLDLSYIRNVMLYVFLETIFKTTRTVWLQNYTNIARISGSETVIILCKNWLVLVM
ncbi:UNVERIFIED_CONTAM: hypothetical protein FKN15_043683 [Acipenser sinensis]